MRREFTQSLFIMLAFIGLSISAYSQQRGEIKFKNAPFNPKTTVAVTDMDNGIT